jgi:hypothetical protein
LPVVWVEVGDKAALLPSLVVVAVVVVVAGEVPKKDQKKTRTR